MYNVEHEVRIQKHCGSKHIPEYITRQMIDARWNNSQVEQDPCSLNFILGP